MSTTLQWILVVLAAVVALTILVQIFGGGSNTVDAPTGAPTMLTTLEPFDR